MHYFNHDEYKMAFEGLIIELMVKKIYPGRFDFAEWKHLVKSYKLNEESVFDGAFWEKFCKWGSSFNKNK